MYKRGRRKLSMPELKAEMVIETKDEVFKIVDIGRNTLIVDNQCREGFLRDMNTDDIIRVYSFHPLLFSYTAEANKYNTTIIWERKE